MAFKGTVIIVLSLLIFASSMSKAAPAMKNEDVKDSEDAAASDKADNSGKKEDENPSKADEKKIDTEDNKDDKDSGKDDKNSGRDNGDAKISNDGNEKGKPHNNDKEDEISDKKKEEDLKNSDDDNKKAKPQNDKEDKISQSDTPTVQTSTVGTPRDASPAPEKSSTPVLISVSIYAYIAYALTMLAI